jgi:myo-inositol catabolism protein IolS
VTLSTGGVERLLRGGMPPQKVVALWRSAALEHGINAFETADIYGLGTSETLLGMAVEGFREHIVIVGRGGLIRSETGHLAFNHSAKGLREEVAASLQRLGTTYLDVFVVHGPIAPAWCEDVATAMERLRAEGLVRWWGVAHGGADMLTTFGGQPGFACYQEPFNLLEPGSVPFLGAACQQAGASLMALRPLGMGLLSGGYRSRPDFRADPERGYPFFQEEGFNGVQPGIAMLRRLAWVRRIAPAQAALAWALMSGAVSVAVGVDDAEQLASCASAGDLVLTPHEAARLSEAFSLR